MLAAAVLIASLLASALGVASYAKSLQREARIALVRAADRLDLIIESRLEACGNLVRAIQLVLGSDPQMSADEYNLRVGALRAERSFPSLQAAALARRSVDADGVESYRTVLVAPQRGNEALWGLDVIRQPENLRVLKQALALDEPRISAPFTLIQHAGEGGLPDGVVIRLPLLSPGVPALTPEERIQRELGSIAVSFRLSVLINQALRALDHPIEYELRLYASEQDGGGLVYSSARAGLSEPGDPQLEPARVQVTYGGRSWALEMLPDQRWYALAQRDAWVAGAISVLASLLLAAFVWSLARTRERAEAMAAGWSLQAQQSEQRFRGLSELLPFAALLARPEGGEVEYINAAGRRLLRVAEGQRCTLSQFGLNNTTLAVSSADTGLPLHGLDGRGFQAALHEAAVEVAGRGLRLLVIEDITERLRMTAQLRHQASHDALTGLFNRHEFDRRLQLAADGRDPELRSACLLYLDLDQFKVINDTCGHAAGDELLARLASVLHACRRDAVVARLGGDEFGILCPVDAAPVIRQIGETLRSAVESMRFVWEGRHFSLTASIGAVAITPELQRSARELLSIADTACYLAKEGGRNKVLVYDEDERASRHRRSEMDWVQRIRQALTENRFCLFYQELHPLHADASARGTHIELLVRMLDERGAVVPPGAFIPAAERFGVMPLVDRWVVTTALRDFARLHPDGAEVGLCSINLSGPTMGDEAFPAFLLDQLRRAAVPPQRLCFEITETAAVANFSQAVALIQELRRLGCKVALDDFGAGMSSFGYLKNLPVDFIKIDGIFIREIEFDPMSQSIVRAVTEIGHQFGTRVVAEFVGRDSTCAMLAAFGVDYAQGFGVHVPEVCPLHAAALPPG